MKLEYLEDNVPAATVIVLTLFLALACGLAAGSGDFKMPMMVIAGIVAMTLVLLAKRKIWILIPATSMLGGKITALPIPFTIAHIGVLTAFIVYLALKALKIVRLKPKTGIVEVWMFVMLAYVATVYIRNPVGVEALGSERVGGRPYVDIIISFLSFWVLSRSIAEIRDVVILPFLGLAGYTFHTAVNFIAYRFPSTVGPLSKLYSSIAAAENPDAIAPMEQGGRLTYLSGLGAASTSVACSYWRPFTLLNPRNLGRFLLFTGGTVAILLSGFRSNLMGIFEVFLLGSYFHRGWREVLKASALAGGFIAVLVLVQGNLVNLPLPAQRTLSFLPGKWDYAAKSEAQGSTEWRVTMWKAMLTEDKYIQSKWFGDGFGFTHRQLEIMEANAVSGSNADQQENLMISGGVHSGPISTIRYVGYVGLLLFLIFLVLIARRGFQLIRRARGTPFFPLVLMYSLTAIALPFNFVFIFGAFEGDFATAIYLVGLQQLLTNTLDAYQSKENELAPETIQPPKTRNIPQFAPN